MNFNYSKIKKNIPYIIAEVGVNHECSIHRAKKLVFLAKKNGADAVKFQSYKADKIASKKSKAYWDTKKEKAKSQYELFSKFDKFNFDDFKILSQYCRKLKIDFLSTPFDLEAVQYLKNLVPVFKVSSSDITNVPLLRKISEIGKPVILSTGASNISEIKFAIKMLQSSKKIKIVLMHCILNYPTINRNANLKMINHLKKVFKNHIFGLSDHTFPKKKMLNISSAFSLGANVIEKHFTIDKKSKGNDHYHSMDGKDLKVIKENILEIKNLLGNSKNKSFIKTELISRKEARRGIFALKDINKNEKFNSRNLITLRPERGIPAKFWDKVINKKARKKIIAGQSIFWKDLSK